MMRRPRMTVRADSYHISLNFTNDLDFSKLTIGAAATVGCDAPREIIVFQTEAFLAIEEFFVGNCANFSVNKDRTPIWLTKSS